MASQPALRRFYRSNLPTVVWDPENSRPLAEFVNGQYYTEDKRTIEKLLQMGYPEVGLDDELPPQIMYEKGRSLDAGEHRPILPPGITEEVMLQRERQAAEQARLKEKAKMGSISQSDAEIRVATSIPNNVNDQGATAGASEDVSPADLVTRARQKATEVVKQKTRTIKRRKK